MDGTTWSRTELAELVRGVDLYVRNANADEIDPPAWLGALAVRVNHYGPAEAVARTHPEDANALIETVLESLMKPGEVCTLHLRALRTEGWSHVEDKWLNQLDNPDVSALICASRVVPGPPIEPPGHVGEAGDSAPSNWALLELDGTGRISSVAGRVAETMEHTAAGLLGRPAVDVLYPDTPDAAAEMWSDLRSRPGSSFSTERHQVRGDGDEVWLRSSYLNPGGADDGRMIVMVLDVTERHRNEQALAASEQELRRAGAELGALAEDLRLLADQVPAAVFLCDGDGRVTFTNARWADLVGATGASTPGALPTLAEIVADDHVPTLAEALATASAGKGDVSVDVQARHGGALWHLQLQSAGGPDGQLVGSIDDITDTVRLLHEAEHDALTGLCNRASVERRLAAALDPVGGNDHLLVLFVDLDGFKQVNDSYGHAVGDLVLQEVACRLAGAVRPGDVVGRYGGDEFVVLCADTEGTAPDDVVQRLRSAISGRVELEGGSWTAEASVGAVRPQLGEDLADVLRRADAAMYEAKRTRRAEGRGPQVRRQV